MNRLLLIAVIILSGAGSLHAQATGNIVNPLLKQHLQSSSVVDYELQYFLLKHVPRLVLPASANQWTADEKTLRAHELSIIYHGWPQAWINEAPNFVQTGVVERHGYRIVKLRYEIVPGFESVALLYEPDHMSGKMPAILDVNGHGAGGKAVEQKQKRCINQARRGIIALSIEFVNFAELAAPGNEHDNLGLLELAGKNGMGLFYLAMRRGLDYLYNDPNVDRARIGITGLSGGGWQTITLSSLDPRIGPAAPVAGFSSLTTGVEHPEYFDFEQNAADVRETVDYAQMDAMRAPRPTLLIYNSMDDCCFRADIVKQGVYSDIKPFYSLYGKPENLQWFMNLIPGTHNYGIDSRERSYEFFDSVFHINASAKEDADTDTEVLSYGDTIVGLPKDNLTILSLAQSFAKSIHHDIPANHGAEWAESQRNLLRNVTRYTPVTVTHAWPIQATHEKDVASMGYRFDFSNGLSATGVFFRSVNAPENAPTVIIMADAGMHSTVVDVANQINRGWRVLVLDPLFFGENSPSGGRDMAAQYEQLLNSVGVRSLGLEAAQINGVVGWLDRRLDHGTPSPGTQAATAKPSTTPVQIITTGLRSETVAMVAVALEPQLFSTFDARQAIPSLLYAFDHPLTYKQAPELMCLDLFRDFDFNTLTAMASPVKVNLKAPEAKRLFWE